MKIVVTIIALTIILGALALYFYQINFNAGSYNVIITNRQHPKQGFGVKIKPQPEVWQFSENQRGGVAESRIFPK